MKEKVFYLLSIFLVTVTTYLILGIWGLFEIKNNDILLFKNKIDLDFHKKYSNKVHHLRDVNKWGKKENEYLFSEISFNDKFSKTILLQGDSWIEDISNISTSEKFVKSYGQNNKYNIYNAGITSFAPSVMHAQYKILKNDFKISPEILIIYIDQTDIGDENCRYKHNKVYSSDGKFLNVQREKYTRATYDYSKLYMYSELNFDSNLIKIFKFPYLKINYFLKRNFNILKQIKIKGYSNRNISKCGFYEIMKNLIEHNSQSETNFKQSLIEYINFLSKEDKIKKIFLVSFPHINHHKNIYKVNVSNYIDNVLLNIKDDRINHINLNKLDFSKTKIEKIYRKNDIGSHLNDQNHIDLFLKNIFSEIKNY